LKQSGGVDIYDILNLDSLSELNYLQKCLSEGMRWEAPLTRSTSMMMTEDVKIGQYTLKAGDIFVIDMYHLHRNKTQWIEPDLYNPDRFDSKSPYYLTPDGKRRHTFAFAPFLGGKRICIGKTFAETSSKFILAMFLNKCGKNLEFVDKNDYVKLPRNNANLMQEAVIMVQAHKA
jgi:cytochrome P450